MPEEFYYIPNVYARRADRGKCKIPHKYEHYNDDMH